MYKKFGILIIIFIVVIIASFFYWQNSSITEKQKQALRQAEIENNNLDSKNNYHPEVSIQALGKMDFNGRNLQIGRALQSTSSYTEYYITYTSEDLPISGVMLVPRGEGPFPVLVLAHGYIDPEVYTNGRGLRREQDYFARNGYVVLHTDYRNHADSGIDSDNDVKFRIGYAVDTINAVYALRDSKLEYIDKENIGVLGHSMGGGVALKMMTAVPGLVNGYSLYAPISAYAEDNFYQWTIDRKELAEDVINLYNLPEANPEFWNNISPATFMDKISEPIILHHGADDAEVPIEWSDKFAEGMKDIGKNITYYVYPDGPHEFINEWNIFMERNLNFFNQHLK